jgi:hypothetical protein
MTHGFKHRVHGLCIYVLHHMPFRHDTSRALDPHLHSHAIVFNATFDAVEKQWKALQNHEMFAAQKFVENVYYHELTRELLKFGYHIENQPRGDFQIKGVSPELNDKFSKRHKQIDAQTRELLAREPDKADGNLAAIRANIAHKERPQKVRDMGLDKLQRFWDGQMTVTEKASLQKLASQFQKVTPPISPLDAIQWAEEHLFERRSRKPVHPDGKIVGATQINVGRNRTVFENFQKLFRRRFDKLVVANQIECFVLAGIFPTLARVACLG